MDKIKKYVANFLKKHERNVRYAMKLNELFIAANMIKDGKPIEAISDVFDLGYAKGYRAAIAEMKKEVL